MVIFIVSKIIVLTLYLAITIGIFNQSREKIHTSNRTKLFKKSKTENLDNSCEVRWQKYRTIDDIFKLTYAEAEQKRISVRKLTLKSGDSSKMLISSDFDDSEINPRNGRRRLAMLDPSKKYFSRKV